MKINWAWILFVAILVLIAYKAGQMSESEGFQDTDPALIAGLVIFSAFVVIFALFLMYTNS